MVVGGSCSVLAHGVHGAAEADEVDVKVGTSPLPYAILTGRLPLPVLITLPRSLISFSACQSRSNRSSKPPPSPSRPHSPVELNPTVPNESTSILSVGLIFKLPIPPIPLWPERRRLPVLVLGVRPEPTGAPSASTTTRWVGGSCWPGLRTDERV